MVGKYSRSAQAIAVTTQALAETNVAAAEYALAESKPAISTSGSDTPTQATPASLSTLGSPPHGVAGRRSLCEQFRPVIESGLQAGLSAQRNTDATVVFTFAATVTGGSLTTLAVARQHGKPCLHLPLRQVQDDEDPALRLQRFVGLLWVHALNVAGSREAKEPGLYLAVSQVLHDAFFWCEAHSGMIGGPGEG